MPSILASYVADKAVMARTLTAVRAFGAPVGLIIEYLDGAGYFAEAVESRDKVYLGTEIGGVGRLAAKMLRIAHAGVYEPFFAMGDRVSAEAAVGQVHFIEHLRREPAVLRARRSGLLICERGPGSTATSPAAEKKGRPLGRPWSTREAQATARGVRPDRPAPWPPRSRTPRAACRPR